MLSTLGERIKESRLNARLSQSQLAKAVHCGSGAVISNWENDVNKPDAEKLVMLCDRLQVSASYLLGYSGRSMQDELFSPSEVERIKKYRDLDDHGKRMVDFVLEEYANRTQVDTPSPKARKTCVVLPFACNLATAGGGFDLGFDAFEELQVPETPTTRRSDFAVRVSDNSMEPLFYDGDILLVKKQDSLDYGQIGIFTINNMGYVKRYQADRLESINPDCDDVFVSDGDDTRVNGVVLGKL